MSMIVYVYNSFNDPLFQGNLFLYLQDQQVTKGQKLLLITHEQKKYTIPKEQSDSIKSDLLENNIEWYPIHWRDGKFKLLDKFFDFIEGFFLVFRLRAFKKANSILSLGSVAAGIAYVHSVLYGLRLCLYQFERHSEFQVDFGLWKKEGLNFKILSFLETRAAKRASVIATGTNHMIKRLVDDGCQANLLRIPSCVNENLFRFSLEKRDRIRQEFLGTKTRNVIVYLGKFGGIYYRLEEVVPFFRRLSFVLDNAFLLIITPDEKEKITAELQKGGFGNTDFEISSLRYEEVPSYLSAGDIGIVNIPPLTTQKFRSPIKVGEYLCCGLPYIVAKGVSEDDQIAEQFNVGVVLEDFTVQSLDYKTEEVKEILSRDKLKLRKMCAEVGHFYRGYETCAAEARYLFADTDSHA